MQKAVMQNRNGVKGSDEFKDLLFTTRFNTPVIEQNFIDAIQRIIDEINTTREILDEFERFTPHCLRHTFATRCIEAGMKPKVLQKILGHATLQMTMDLYAHVLFDTKMDEMELLEAEMCRVDGMTDDIVNQQYEKCEKARNKIIAFEAV